MKAVVHGRVQGVFYRASTRAKAKELGLTGWVRNLPGGKAVEVTAEGEKTDLEKLSRWLKEGPPGAIVERVEINWAENISGYSDFRFAMGRRKTDTLHF